MPRRSEQAGSARGGRAAGPAPDVFVPRGGVNDGPRHDDPVPLHRLDVPTPHLLPFAIGSFDTIGPLARANFPHRHSFHEIAYVTGGRGAHVVDLVRRPLCPPELSVIVPGQVHHWEQVTQLHGWVILFTEDFLLAHPGDRDALATLGGCPGLRVTAGVAPRIGSLVAEMVREHGERADGFTSVLQAQLHILIAQALRLPGVSGPSPASGRMPPLAREFAALLARPGAAGRTVRSYAEELGVSVGHLTEVVKRGTGRTPGGLIRHAQTVEAKRLLSGSGLSVAQVAARLGFADPAYFCRFFRRETGVSPGDFRRATSGTARQRADRGAPLEEAGA
ncbi:helix-turn-helix domain-containing protein [Streptomyces catenulae]|uniref:Helix-turn-helix domain-containing protein n=1 Tax=Streptomyces catenulae TaxID=66875 RepID=A0ABV2YZ61_9ACTN|nr:helix-turn-helix domain-containing protein [Streptomyces catenulae]